MSPQLSDVATAILSITAEQLQDRFKPSQVTDYLMQNGFSHIERRYLSAPVSNKLKELEIQYNGVVIRDSEYTGTKNIPRIIKNRVRLHQLCGSEATQSNIDHNKVFPDPNGLEQAAATTELNDSTSEKAREHIKAPMDVIIREHPEFKKNFYLQHVISRLGDIPFLVYHHVVQACFEIINFEAASSPAVYTKHPHEMPLLKMGKLSDGRSMLEPSFGLTSHTQVINRSLEGGIYIWLSKRAFDQSGMGLSELIRDHCSWRGDGYVLPDVPLASQKYTGWFVRTLSEDDRAAKILQVLKIFSITPVEKVENCTLTPLELNAG